MSPTDCPVILIEAGDFAGLSFPLLEDVSTIGRESQATVHLVDGAVSRNHCRIFRQDSTYFLCDGGSRNGTRLNGKSIETSPLNLGDQIEVGNVLLRFVELPRCHWENHQEMQVGSITTPTQSLRLDVTDPEIIDILDEESSRLQLLQLNEQPRATLQADLEWMVTVSRLITRPLGPRCLTHAFLHQCLKSFDPDVAVFFRNGSQNPLDDRHPLIRLREEDPANVPTQLKIHQRLVRHALNDRVAVFHEFDVPASGSSQRSRWLKTTQPREGRRAVCVPAVRGSRLLGLLYLEQRVLPEQSRPLDADRFPLLVAGVEQLSWSLNAEDTEQELATLRQFSSLGELTSVTSHRVNNLLQVLEGGSFLVDTGLKSGDMKPILEGWQVVKRQQASIARLSLNLQAFSRDLEPHFESRRPAELLSGALASVGETLDISRVESSYSAEFQSAKCRIDGFFMNLALESLLAVAVQTAKQDGNPLPVTLSGSVWDGHWLLDIDFPNTDERFDLQELARMPATKLKIEHGLLEIIGARKHIEEQGGQLILETMGEKQNRIQLRLPLEDTGQAE